MRAMRPTLLLAALLGAAAPASGQSLADYDYEHLAFRGLGVDFGYLWAERVRDTETFGVRLDLGYLGPGVRIVPSLGYWASEFTRAELDALATRMNEQTGGFIQGSDLEPIEWSDISLSLDAHFVWNTPIRVLTFIGGGAGLHALNGQGNAVDDTFVEDLLDSITAGLNALAGLEFQPVPRLRVYAEGRYTALNSIQYLQARGGLQLMFDVDDGVDVGAVVPPPPVGGVGR